MNNECICKCKCKNYVWNAQVLLRLWKHESKRVIADRFTAPEDVAWFDCTLAKLVEDELGEEERMILDVGVDTYFVDFLRDAPEATGTDQTRNITIHHNLNEKCGFKWLWCFISEQVRNQRKQISTCRKCTSP